MADIWTGALVSLTGIVVGVGLAELRAWLKERKTKRRVAIALTMEVTAMADMVATCASFANFAEFELKDEELNTQTLLAMLPPEPTAYRALAGQLPLLDIENGIGCRHVLWHLGIGEAAQHTARIRDDYS
jgi:hypothetical protein